MLQRSLQQDSLSHSFSLRVESPAIGFDLAPFNCRNSRGPARSFIGLSENAPTQEADPLIIGASSRFERAAPDTE